MITEYSSISDVKGPLVIVQGVKDVAYGEIVEVRTAESTKLGQVLEISKEHAVIQLFEKTTGIDTKNTTVRFTASTMTVPVGKELLGRMFDGLGKPIDGQPEIIPEKEVDINGLPINPYRREYPQEFIQTGISAIDVMNTLVRGQKLPIFSGAGLPHNRMTAQIIRQAKVLGKDQQFAVVLAAMGITSEEAQFFRKDLEESGALQNSVLYLNLADDPAIERIMTPRMALSAAEYLAFEKNMHVLVILTDMTNYCEALREISAARNEIPGRRGYPGYMYTDLASLYERAGRIKGKEGSVTQIPIISMPDDDITHPIPDLTGYITEGQFVMSRDILHKSIFPPVDVLPSLSRLMTNGIGEGKTRADHYEVANQMYALYAEGRELRDLVAVIGKDSLSDRDRLVLDFAEKFETEFINQGDHEERPIEESLKKAWDLLKMIPKEELKRIDEKTLEKYYAH